MRWYYKLPLRLRSLFRRNNAELDLSEELQFHAAKRSLGRATRTHPIRALRAEGPLPNSGRRLV